MFNSVSLASNQTSSATFVGYTDNHGIAISWTGTSPIGSLVVEVTNDVIDQPSITPSWIALDFGSAITISGASGNHLINVNQGPYHALRMRYVFTSGTGNLTAKLTSKQV